jgi:hypothetical protein
MPESGLLPASYLSPAAWPGLSYNKARLLAADFSGFWPAKKLP